MNVGGHLYELGELSAAEMFHILKSFSNIHSTPYKLPSLYVDGRKPFPIVHGKTSEDTLLEVRHEKIRRLIP